MSLFNICFNLIIKNYQLYKTALNRLPRSLKEDINLTLFNQWIKDTNYNDILHKYTEYSINAYYQLTKKEGSYDEEENSNQMYLTDTHLTDQFHGLCKSKFIYILLRSDKCFYQPFKVFVIYNHSWQHVFYKYSYNCNSSCNQDFIRLIKHCPYLDGVIMTNSTLST